MRIKNILLSSIFLLAIFFNSSKVLACHGMPLVNFTIVAGPLGITINGSSDSPTCGCGPYYMQAELACNPNNFNGNVSYQSLLNVPNYGPPNWPDQCAVEPYHPIFIPYANLNAGCTYYLRVRENPTGGGTPGPWMPTYQFTVPGQAPAPFVVTQSQTADTICIGGNSTLCVNATGGCFTQGNYTYTWNGGATTPCINVTPTVTTNYNVIVSTGCEDTTLFFTVVVDSMPSAGPAAINNGSICLGQNDTLTLGVSIGQIQWQWAPTANGPWTDIPGANGNMHVLVAPQSSLCYRAQLTSCFGTQFAYSNVVCLTVTPPPTVTVADKYICETKSGTLEAVVSTPGGTYNWVPGNITTPTMTDSPQWTTTYTVTYSVGPCKVPAQGTIFVNAKPYVDFFSDTVCLGNKTTFIDNTSLGLGSSINTWQWYFGDGNTSNTQNNLYTYGTYGYFNVKLVVTSDSGCVDSITKQVRVYDKPNADFTTKNICIYETANFLNQSTVNSANIVLNKWTLGNGTDTTIHSFNYNYQYYGAYNVQLIVVTNQGCADTIVKPIVVNPQPSSIFTATNVCETYATTFQNYSIIPHGSITGWLWYYGNGGSSNAFNDSYTYNTWGNYKVTLIAISDSGCKDTSEVYVDVFPKPIPDFSLSTTCQNDTILFNDLSTIGSGTVSSWYWNFGDGSPTSSQTSPKNIFYTPGTYNVQLVITSDKGCVAEMIKPTDIYPKPKAEFSYSDELSGCSPLCVNFFDQSTITNEFNSTIQYYKWTFNDGELSAAKNPVHCFTNRSKDRKIFTVELEVVSDYGCKSYYIVKDLVDVYPQPIAEFTFDPAVTTILNPLFHFKNHSHYETSLSWNFGDGNSTNIENPKHTYGDTGTYDVTLVVKNDWGCTDTVVYKVVVKPDVIYYIPNSFTPNGDGINDVFNIKGRLELIQPETFKMKIYDRWGELIFETNDIAAGWNGTVNNKKVETEVYVYVFSFKDKTDESHNLKGTVTVVR
ncbi:Collagenase ColH [Flavobacteriales bacterium]|nr:hypothetical protein [Flavobacteriales bacterium]MCL4817319.1 PKD domain-containing protein [Flavobacteriales bacterium]WKZ74161.1 MAG: PKD domain-containing protein [Vicingaceae bacterium]CAG0974482.1 Collagenase ColH [Flavobacteriales bacterium]